MVVGKTSTYLRLFTSFWCSKNDGEQHAQLFVDFSNACIDSETKCTEQYTVNVPRFENPS